MMIVSFQFCYRSILLRTYTLLTNLSDWKTFPKPVSSLLVSTVHLADFQCQHKPYRQYTALVHSIPSSVRMHFISMLPYLHKDDN